MPQSPISRLSRRERQIMDVLYRRGKATVADVLADLDGEPNYSTVRAQLRVLEEKGQVRHEEIGMRYVYTPTLPPGRARVSALRHVVDTFFEGSAEKVVAALLGGSSKLSQVELDRLAEMIEQARKEGSQ